MKKKILGVVLSAFLVSVFMAEAASAASCKNRGSFGDWLENFKREAVAQGVSRSLVLRALDGITLDPKVIALDRRQSVFAQSFLKFAGRMVAKYRMQKGRQLIKKYGRTFSRIKQQYGVPAPVLVAFWGLETDFGVNNGKMSTLRSLATLAYDCRRPELFREQLLAALNIIQRGDLSLAEMKGPWAGELGQMQFLPSHYLEYAVDYDGDGRRNLLRSVPDVLASSANFMRHLGWKANQPWLQEVRVPAQMPWAEADIAIDHPRSKWSRWGVRRADGRPLPADNVGASLLLPMGRLGPAFLAYYNFKKIYLEWNQSLVYATTAAYFATRLGGAPQVSAGRGRVTPLKLAEVKELQRLLKRRGFDVGEKIDGIIGAATRSSVKAMQIKLGLPADSYPTHELLNRLRR